MSGGRMAALAAALIAVLCAGIWLGAHPSHLPSPLRDAFVDDSSALTSEATQVIEDNYYRSVGADALSDYSVAGMVQALRKRFKDRFSNYFGPKQLAEFNDAIAGHFAGVGLNVTEVKKGLRVATVFPKTPAEAAGIKPGDIVVSVNGSSLAGVDSNTATEKIKGPEGTEVTIGVLRPSTGRTRSLKLKRAEVSIPVTQSHVRTVNGHKIGYVRLTTFSQDSHDALRRAVEKVERMGAEAIVLDLRSNGGGLLNEAVSGASIFLPKGDIVVSTDSRTEGKAVYDAEGDPLPSVPMVVLIDRFTASAAEILTAALADDVNATVVGTRSYGKGVFQQEIDLPNGGALKLTTGEYFTPKGVNLAGKGIKPDVRAKDNPKTKVDEGLAKAYSVLAAKVGSGTAGQSGN